MARDVKSKQIEGLDTLYFEKLRAERSDLYADRSIQLFNLLDEQGANWVMSVINQRIGQQGTALNAHSFIEESLRYIIETSNTPTILLSTNQQLLFSNRQAEAFLEEQSSLLIDTGYLKGSSPEYDKLFKQKIKTSYRNTTKTIEDDPNTIFLLRAIENGAPLFAAIRTIKLSDSKSPIVAIEFHNPATLPKISIAKLRGWYGLSKREALLAVSFAKGTPLQDYAKQQDIAITTVRTQFAQIKTKMNAKNQATVVRLTLLAQE